MQHVPYTTFKSRVRNEAIEGDNPFEWKDINSSELFKDKRVVLFSLPGAFTPTCSASHLPRYEELYKQFIDFGVEDNCPTDPFDVSDADTMLGYLKLQTKTGVA
jgi:peroxiredoxin